MPHGAPCNQGIELGCCWTSSVQPAMALQGSGASPGTTSLLWWRCSNPEGLQWHCNHGYLYQCSRKCGVWVFLSLQQDMAVPLGSAAACLEERPAWTEQKLTRTFGACSGYAGSRPRGIFAFQFQTGNYKWIQLAGSVVWEDTQRHGNRETQECWWRTFPPLKCTATLSSPLQRGKSWLHAWEWRAPASCSHLGKWHLALPG